MNTKKLLLAACAALFASVGAFAIDAPGGLTASDGTSAEKIEISWNEVDGADAYILTRNGTGVSAAGRAEWTVTGTSFVDTTAVAGLPWLYRVQAVKGGAKSDYSPYEQGYRLVALAVEGQCVVVPSAARSTSATAMGSISVKCNTSWTAKPATDEDAWILPDSSTAFGNGDGVLRIGAEANTTGALRRGRVQISSRGTNVFFTVVQGSAGGTDETPADALDAYVRLEGEDPVARPVTLMQDFASGFAIAPSGLGTTCLRTGPMTAGESAAVCVMVEGEGQLVFSWKKAPGSAPGDAYEVYVNDAGPTLLRATRKATCSSEEWTEVKFALKVDRPHYVIWKYAKAGSDVGGGFLGNVQFLGQPVSLEISVNSTLLQRDGSNSVQTVLTDTFGQRSVVHPDWETKYAHVSRWSSSPQFNIASGAPADVDWIRSAQHPTHMVTEVFDLRAVYSVDLGDGLRWTVRSDPVTITDVPPLCYALLHEYSNDTIRVSGSWRSEALNERHDRADGYFAAQNDGGALLLRDGIDCAAVADVGDEDEPDEMSLVMEPTHLLFNSFFENPAADSRIELYVNDETEPRYVIFGTDCTRDWTRQEVHFEAEPEPFTLRFRFCRGEGEGTRAYVDRLVQTSIDPAENFRARFSYDSRLVLAWDGNGYDSYEIVAHTDGGDILWVTDKDSLDIETLPPGTYDFTITPVRETTDFLDRPMTLRGQSSTLTATVSDRQGVSIYDAPGLTFETGGDNEWFVIRDDDGYILPPFWVDDTGICLQSAPIDPDTNSTLRALAVGPGRIDFRYQASCGFYCRFKIKLNGELVEEIEDTREPNPTGGPATYVWRDYSLELPYGTNTVEWVYEKPWYGGGLPLGCDDCCRISVVKFVAYAFTGETRIAGQSYIAAGAAPGVFTFEADYRDDADCLRTYAVPLDESAWSCESSDPFSALSVASEVLSDGTLGVTVADDLMFTGYVVISAETVIDGELQSDTVYSTVKQITVEDALNGEGTDLAYTVMHPDTWMVTLEESPPDGKGMCLEAAASRSTDGWSSRVFCATVTGRGKLSFWWKKASNSGMSGRIYFSVDQEINAQLCDGGTGWQQVEVNFEDDGPHALSWEFYDVYDEEDDKIYVGDVRWDLASTDLTFVEAFMEGPDVVESVGDNGIEYRAWLVYRVGDEQVTNPCYNAVWDANGAVDQWGEEIPRQKVDCLTLYLRNTSETNETFRLSLDVAVEGGTYTVEKEITIAPYIDPLKAISDGALPLRLQEFYADNFVGQTNVVHVGKSALKTVGESSMAEIVVIGSGRLTFDWKTVGKGAVMYVEAVTPDWEYIETARISGTTDWQTCVIDIEDDPEFIGGYHYVYVTFAPDPYDKDYVGYLDNCTWTSTMAPVPLKTGLGLDGTDAIVTAGGSALWESFPNGQGGYRAYYSCTNGGTSASVSMQVRGEGNGSFCYMLDATGGTITFKVDGETVETFSPNGDPWERCAEFSVTGAGDHTLEWVAEGFTTADLVALCWFSWGGEYPVPDEPPKIATDDGVPYAWLVQYGIEQGPDRWETAQNLRAANGVNTVRECWLLGLNPTNESSKFTAFIEMVDGEPVVTWSPDRSDEPNPPVTYTVEGKAALDDGEDWAPKTGEHKFFRVKVTEVK